MSDEWAPMSRFWSCKKCNSSWAVLRHDADIELLKSKKMRCPNHDVCQGYIYEITKLPKSSDKVTRLAAVTLWQGTMGVGLPEQRRCTPEELLKVMKGAKIETAVLESASNPQRSIIHCLILDNGKTIHFAPSPNGALIFKVT